MCGKDYDGELGNCRADDEFGNRRSDRRCDNYEFHDDDYEVCWRIWTLRRNGFRRRSLSFQITKREREVLGSWRCEHEYGRRCCLEWFD